MSTGKSVKRSCYFEIHWWADGIWQPFKSAPTIPYKEDDERDMATAALIALNTIANARTLYPWQFKLAHVRSTVTTESEMEYVDE